MDGLLIDTIPAYVGAMVQAGHDVGHVVSKGYVLSLVGLLGAELEAQLRADQGATFPMAAYLTAVFARLGPILSRGSREGRRFPAARRTGAGEYADGGWHLHDAEGSAHHLNHCDVDHFFRVIAARDDVARGKPHPDVHLKALSALGFDACDCLILEDSFNGVRAAHATGAMVILVPDVVAPTPEIEALCTLVASDLHQVREIIRRDARTP
jgi:beta-phosphoglucomutase-like phosphatase (HAD superfamily)